jgi:hypothetical protein
MGVVASGTRPTKYALPAASILRSFAPGTLAFAGK